MRPIREKYRKQESAYFISTQTSKRKPFFRHERWAKLMEETLLHYSGSSYSLHAYVIMPDHVHLLIIPKESLEKAVQLIKGGFSFRAKRELGWKFDIWQPGFTDHRIRDEQDWDRHLEYVRRNPTKIGLIDPYPYVAFPSADFPQGLKPHSLVMDQHVRAEARTLHAEAHTLHAEAHTLHAEGRTG